MLVRLLPFSSNTSTGSEAGSSESILLASHNAENLSDVSSVTTIPESDEPPNNEAIEPLTAGSAVLLSGLMKP